MVTIALMGLSAAVWNVVWGVRKGGLTGEARADAGGAGEVNSVVSCGSSWVVWCVQLHVTLSCGEALACMSSNEA